MSNLVRGTLILTVATMISKVLGFIYVVPFTALVGTQGYILFEYAYKPYVIILSFATMGVPLAVSKFVSKYNELGDYQTGQKLFKSGLVLLTATGVICFALLFFLSPTIASYLIDEKDPTGNSLQDVTFVIQMVSFALIIVPPMAIARGFFQGYQSMEPTAISQVVEQFIRLAFILIGSYIAIHMLHKNTSFAVGLATLAAFVGAIGGCIVLFMYWLKRKKELQEYAKKSSTQSTKSLPSMYKELISYAIPFVIVGLAIPLYQTVDTFTINRAMMTTGVNQLQAETVNSVVALVQKIILIPVSLATAFGLTLVPAVTKSYVNRDFKTLHHEIKKTYQTIWFLVLPCVAGLMVLAGPSYSSLFGVEDAKMGAQLMLWNAPSAILLSFFLVSVAILQGMDRHRFAVISMFIGLLIKLITNTYFIVHFEGVGSVIATCIGFAISIALNTWAIQKYATFKFSSLYKQTFHIIVMVIIMSALVWGVDFFFKSWIVDQGISDYLQYILRLCVGAVVGGISYVIMSAKANLLEEFLGKRYASLINKVLRVLYIKRT